MTAVVNRVVTLDQIAPHPDNYNKHPKKQISDLRASLRKFGQVRSVVVQAPVDSGRYLCVAGHGLTEAAAAEGLTELRADVLPADWPPHKVRAYLVADNNHAKRSEVDEAQLAAMVGDIVAADAEYMAAMAFDEKDLAGMGIGAAPVEDVEPAIDRAEELRAKWGVEPGQLWRLGEHRLICGDCTDRSVVERVMDGQKPDCMVTDPPYCSGGFQEAGKKSGSIGTRGDEMIANDTLSTRGYMALMKSVFLASDCGVAYVFTDWRMWVNLFDVAESSGYGVRNMVVWDKETPGMGRGWRSQHELVLCAMKVTQPFDPHKAQGNVIRCSRTGNVLHPTEKPVELIEKILDVTDIARVIFEPFSGSGTTLMACESMGRSCRAIELSPKFVAVALERWSVATGKTPELVP